MKYSGLCSLDGTSITRLLRSIKLSQIPRNLKAMTQLGLNYHLHHIRPLHYSHIFVPDPAVQRISRF